MKRSINLDNDVIFSVFDNREGPLILYSSLDSPEKAQKIAIRSFIAIGAMEEDQDLRGKQAVVPLPSINKIAFYYMFRVTVKDPILDKKSCWANLGFITDSSSSVNFFHTIPIIQKNIIPIIELIQENFTYKGRGTKLSGPIITSISSLRTPVLVDNSEDVTSISLRDETLGIQSDEGFQKGDLEFLFGYFKENLDKVIYSLMLEEPILIIGDIKEIVQKTVASLELLVPHRILVKKYLTSYLDPKDEILICSSHVNFLKKYKGITNVNVIDRKIESKIKGVPSISNLINTLKIAPKGTQQKVIKIYIDNLLVKTTQLMELCEKEQVEREEINNFRGNLKADELNIVISMVRRYAPQFEAKLFHFARSLV
ncbi:MAG: hypothetical protein ACXADA_00825 [Candidatus Hodarchaeales archaeon]